MESNVVLLCDVNPKAGKEEKVLSKVRDVFGTDVRIEFLEEESNFYILGDFDHEIVDKMKEIQADQDVIDTQIEIMKTRHVLNKEVKTDFVYLMLVDVEQGKIDSFLEKLDCELEKVASGDITLLFSGEIYSYRADVVLLFAVNGIQKHELSLKVRNIPGVEDSTILTLKHTSQK